MGPLAVWALIEFHALRSLEFFDLKAPAATEVTAAVSGVQRAAHKCPHVHM